MLACFMKNIVTMEKKITDFHVGKVGTGWALPPLSDLRCYVCIKAPAGEANEYFSLWGNGERKVH